MCNFFLFLNRSIIAIAGPDFVLIGSNLVLCQTDNVSQYFQSGQRILKFMFINRTCIAITGPLNEITRFDDSLSKEIQKYYARTRRYPLLDSIQSILVNVLHNRKYCIHCIVAGIDKNGEGVVYNITGHDGYVQKMSSCSMGEHRDFLSSILYRDMNLETVLTCQKANEIIQTSFKALHNRKLYTPGIVHFHYCDRNSPKFEFYHSQN